MTKRVIIHAPSVHTGGGRVLLCALLKCALVDINFFFNINSKIEGNLHADSKHELKYFSSTLFSRFFSEISLFRLTKKKDVVICFGNLPPLLKPKGQVFIFVQNKLLVDKTSLSPFPFRVKVSIQVQRIIFKFLLKRSYHLIVQSQAMYDLMFTHQSFPELKRIHLLPLVPFNLIPKNIDSVKSINIGIKKFIYVASGDAHKNHLRLLKAWELLAKDGLYPHLILTLDEKSDVRLLDVINELRLRLGILIVNLGALDHERVMVAYKSADVLIFPSFVESFGLPLIEASNASLPIIASELDFVRDLVIPVQTFDPFSVVSIVRAVKRYLGVHSQKNRLLGPKEFIEKILVISNG